MRLTMQVKRVHEGKNANECASEWDNIDRMSLPPSEFLYP